MIHIYLYSMYVGLSVFGLLTVVSVAGGVGEDEVEEEVADAHADRKSVV